MEDGFRPAFDAECDRELGEIARDFMVVHFSPPRKSARFGAKGRGRSLFVVK